MRNKRERQQQVPDTIGQNKPRHSRSEFPKKKKPKFQAERGKEGGKEVLFTFEGESQKENKALNAAPHTQPSSLSGSKSNPQSQIRQEKRGKRRNPAAFGKPHPRLQQNLGKRKLGWSLPSPQLGSRRGGGALEDLNGEKREKIIIITKFGILLALGERLIPRKIVSSCQIHPLQSFQQLISGFKGSHIKNRSEKNPKPTTFKSQFWAAMRFWGSRFGF